MTRSTTGRASGADLHQQLQGGGGDVLPHLLLVDRCNLCTVWILKVIGWKKISKFRGVVSNKVAFLRRANQTRALSRDRCLEPPWGCSSAALGLTWVGHEFGVVGESQCLVRGECLAGPSERLVNPKLEAGAKCSIYNKLEFF